MSGRGPVLDSEFEQFAKFFAQPAELNVGPDSPTPRPLELLNPGETQYGHSFDLGQEQLAYVQSFPYVLTRRSPVSSPPPAGYSLVRSNAFYELWHRDGAPRAVSQLPLRGPLGAGAAVKCNAVKALAARARPSQRLVLAEQPAPVGFAMVEATEHSPTWGIGPDPKAFLTPAPGRASREVTVPAGGRYELWVEGNLPRRMAVTLDGRTVGTAQGTDAPGGWSQAGTVTVTPGRHVLGVLRGGGSLLPGNGSTQASVGAVAMVPAGARPRLVTVAPSDWRKLCGKRAYWVEIAGA
jgi:hypothetical protein